MQEDGGPEVQKLSGNMPVLYFREGDRRDEVMKLIDEEPSISILCSAPRPDRRARGRWFRR